MFEKVSFKLDLKLKQESPSEVKVGVGQEKRGKKNFHPHHTTLAIPLGSLLCLFAGGIPPEA